METAPKFKISVSCRSNLFAIFGVFFTNFAAKMAQNKLAPELGAFFISLRIFMFPSKLVKKIIFPCATIINNKTFRTIGYKSVSRQTKTVQSFAPLTKPLEPFLKIPSPFPLFLKGRRATERGGTVLRTSQHFLDCCPILSLTPLPCAFFVATFPSNRKWPNMPSVGDSFITTTGADASGAQYR